VDYEEQMKDFVADGLGLGRDFMLGRARFRLAALTSAASATGRRRRLKSASTASPCSSASSPEPRASHHFNRFIRRLKGLG